MGDVRLVAPRVRVIRDGHEPLEVQADNRDLVRWDMTRLRQRPVWPTFQDAPFKWLTFLSWSACVRQELVPADTRYEAWEDTVLSVSDVSQDDTAVGDDETGRPTDPGPGPG